MREKVSSKEIGYRTLDQFLREAAVTYGYRISMVWMAMHFDQIVAIGSIRSSPSSRMPCYRAAAMGRASAHRRRGINDAVDETGCRWLCWQERNIRVASRRTGEFAKVGGGGSASGKLGKTMCVPAKP